MPIIRSAKKALRVSKKKKLINEKREKKMKESIKNLTRVPKDAKRTDAEKALALAYSAIDKAAKRGIIKKNTASRKKARLSRLIKSNKK